MRAFASDNYAGVHPTVMSALAQVNTEHARPYGADSVSAEVTDLLREQFRNPAAEVLWVATGTGANVVALQTLLRPWQHVLAATTAHILNDECGAVERITGCKVVGLPTDDGRITPEQILASLDRVDDVHASQPGVLSITQSTEYGTCYTAAQIAELVTVAHEHHMWVHLDGARLSNAAVALDATWADLTAGVDVVSLGGTKNGLLCAEAVVILNPEFAAAASYVRKQCGQLMSKQRYVAAQFKAWLADGLWAELAGQANLRAQQLELGVRDLPGLTVTQSAETNMVFATLPRNVIEPLQDQVPFYSWNEAANEVRWVCSWDTTPSDVESFVALLRRQLG